MGLEQMSAICGLAGGMLVLMTTLIRQRRFDLQVAGSVLAGFLAASALPTAVLMGWYGVASSPQAVLTEFEVPQRFIVVGGLSIALVSLVGLSALVRNAMGGTTETSGGLDLPSVPEKVFLEKTEGAEKHRSGDRGAGH